MLLSFTINVDVTQKHIDGGIECMFRNCPVALAIRDAIKDIIDCSSVGAYYNIYVYKTDELYGEVLYTAPTPNLVHEFMNNFDEGEPVKPFSFVVTLNKIGTR